MSEGEPVAALFFDLSRAFDSLNLDFMERKLCAFGFRGCTLEWLLSYLRARRLKIGGNTKVTTIKNEEAAGIFEKTCLEESTY
ncbi:hypothetical protein HHI36_023612 [Cryptolaemus montrouzieri]|uniref:Reverse transcriptase domain-containing protein n=1 Tax=Cryptolaemus montrouzieri TaxID=559131 RepID=A0ABD2PHN2_9CUCU